jgi:hypothetical protein
MCHRFSKVFFPQIFQHSDETVIWNSPQLLVDTNLQIHHTIILPSMLHDLSSLYSCVKQPNISVPTGGLHGPSRQAKV